ncbi:Piso0_001138 [Millerozyma farinosa CBS 7064]|uniref:Piso0_001138 protein n=1 Tax=Pichia sorbitophila (strain ATCC MYA-4447 / BCRC 22081 / CBS 7064 / NBRC 10061 / NRRL Y-12695) TaxID=559304 RepID=G8YPC8_PICSO|nr:Piso0_001138 [Millerozyma farinosa CBS 7064]CCE79099.1 Piso0_001138 [Millerozyma farinosa CBS 7064]
MNRIATRLLPRNQIYSKYPGIQCVIHKALPFFFIRTYGIPKKNKLPPRPLWLIKEEELEEEFIKGGRGPGGQKINKTNSKVQLRHKPTNIVVTCQYSRSQEQNRKKAREILALKLEELENPEHCRTAVLKERESKVKQNKMKKSTRKYKKIEEERQLQKEKEQELLSEIVDIDSELDTLVTSAKQKVDNR